jgi:VanZ family protein
MRDVESAPSGLKFFARFTLPTLAYLACISWGSHRPGVQAPLLVPHLDKLYHLFEYAPVGALFHRWFSHHPRLSGQSVRWCIAAAVGCGVAFAIADECHQAFVPGRSPEGLDILADGLGVLAGAWAWSRAQGWFRRRAIRNS